MSTGSLTVIGSGMTVAGQLTAECADLIHKAKVLYAAMPTQISLQWLKGLNSATQSLGHLYQKGKSRRQTYRDMTELVLSSVRMDNDVCVVFYGHPGVFVTPSHQMIQQARQEGYFARMLPGISAEDCLFSDLGFDPAASGCQSYEAMDFLLRGRIFDPTAALILWQIGAVGDYAFDRSSEGDQRWMNALVEKLQVGGFPPSHEIILYEASILPIWPFRADTIRLDQLADANLNAITTLYVPPLRKRKYDAELLKRMGISSSEVG